MPRPLIATSKEQAKLYQLQAEWAISSPLAREAIAQNIADHPEWQIDVEPNGPIKRTSTHCPQNTPLNESSGGEA